MGFPRICISRKQTREYKLPFIYPSAFCSAVVILVYTRCIFLLKKKVYTNKSINKTKQRVIGHLLTYGTLSEINPP